MKIRYGLLLLIVLVLFSACHKPGGTDAAGSEIVEKHTDTLIAGEVKSNANITQDQAIQIIKSISSSEVDIEVYPEFDKLVDNIRYYYLKAVYSNGMSAAYYVDEKEGKAFIAVGGELDTDNPLPTIKTDKTNKANDASDKTDGAAEVTAKETAVIKNLFETIGMTGQQVEQKYGKSYKKIFVNYDGNMEGYLFSDEGFTVAFENNGTVSHVYCTDKIDINGASSGMDFAQIQDILGETVCRQTWIETPINTAYEIMYTFNGKTVVFFSRQQDGSNCIMSIQ